MSKWWIASIVHSLPSSFVPHTLRIHRKMCSKCDVIISLIKIVNILIAIFYMNCLFSSPSLSNHYASVASHWLCCTCYFIWLNGVTNQVGTKRNIYVICECVSWANFKDKSFFGSKRSCLMRNLLQLGVMLRLVLSAQFNTSYLEASRKIYHCSNVSPSCRSGECKNYTF